MQRHERRACKGGKTDERSVGIRHKRREQKAARYGCEITHGAERSIAYA
jgi:hypothetical protein